MAAMKMKAEIDAELARLEALLPRLIADEPADHVLEAFATEAAAIEESKPAEYVAYINGRINCMLASAGLIPGETEGEPCPKG